jgi:benzoate/toluate 1,2-dioxygenase reductase component
VTSYTIEVIGHRWLTDRTFEIRFQRPTGFDFLPGQKIGFVDGAVSRDYTPLGPAGGPELAFCVRHIPRGRFSTRLAGARPGDRFQVTPPFGYFTFHNTSRPSVCVATGTGIAPFVAFARSGVRGFDLLHGVRSAGELYYSRELSGAARQYVPCISGEAPPTREWPLAFAGHVGGWLAERLPPGAYDFYLCGRGDMIRDVMGIIDDRFEGSLVFTETFF